MSKDPVALGVDLHISKLLGEGVVRTTWTRIHPRGHLPLAERLNTVTKKGPYEVYASQPSLQ
jgi:hypothetical protein